MADPDHEDQMLRLLAAEGELTESQMAERLGWANDLVATVVTDLERRGLTDAWHEAEPDETEAVLMSLVDDGDMTMSIGADGQPTFHMTEQGNERSRALIQELGG